MSVGMLGYPRQPILSSLVLQDEVRQALRDTGLDAREVNPIGDGWANWTFLIDGTLIVRFPRSSEIADATRRELRLLPELARHLSFAVPNPKIVGEWAGQPFFAYERIGGRPLGPEDRSIATALGLMLDELHSFPVIRAAELLGTPPPAVAWSEHLQELWPVVEQIALPQLDQLTSDMVKSSYSRMVEHPPDFPTCLIHNDLGPQHLLIGGTGQPVGLIDFEDAWLGDPATDLSPLVACLGWSVLPELVAGRDLGQRLDERIRFYRWMGSIHAIIYGVREHVESERIGGIQELRRRLEVR